MHIRTALKLSSGLTVLMASSFAAPALAQTVDDEIIVTAQRREQNIQDVPIAVTAVSGELLEDIGAVDITDIQKLTPNATIEVARGSNSTLIAFIRGVGQQDPLWGFEPGVGIYVDDVYIARPQGAVMDIFDVERIEVLRGPQGTLYGRNTIGGAVKYVTKGLNMDAPELEAKVNVGNYKQFEQIVSGSFPITDTFAVGGAIAHYKRAGFGENLNTGADHYDKDVLSGRLSAEWAPNDDLNFKISGDMTEDKSNAKHGQRLLPSFDGTLAVTSNEYDTRAGAGDDNSVKTSGASLTASWYANDEITLKSITAFRRGKSKTQIDFDALPQSDFDVPADYKDKQFSQEVQLLYEGERLSGIAGLYYLDGTSEGGFDAILDGYGLTVYTAGSQTKKNVSGYADFTFDATERVALSLGARYTNDKTEADVAREIWLGHGSGSFDPSNTTSIFFRTETDYEGLKRKDDQFTPRASVSFEVTPETNLYASYSRGFKAGGFDPRANDLSDVANLSRDGFGPETVDSYEIGAKGSWLDNRLLFALTGFIADYKDQQITVQRGADLLDANGNPGSDGNNDTFTSTVFNAGKSKYKGIEFEGRFHLSEEFSLSGTLGYIDAKIKEILDDQQGNIADQFVTQNTPKLTAQLGFMYDHDLRDNMGNLVFTGSVSHRDEYYLFNVPNQGFGPGLSAFFPDGGPQLDPDAENLVDLGVNWTSYSGRWNLGLFGRNLTDERTRIAAYNFVYPSQLGIDGAYSAFYSAPRTVTASIGFKY